MNTGPVECITHVLPVRSNNPKILVELGKLDIFRNHPYCGFEFFQIHGMLGFRRVIVKQFKIPSKYGEFISDIMPGNLCKKVEFLIGKLQCILRFSDIRNIVENPYHRSAPAQVEYCCADYY